MYTLESFCNSVFNRSYAMVSSKISKSDYKTFTIPKKGGTRTINFVESGTDLWNIQGDLLNNFLVKQDLPICVKGFVKGENYQSYLSEHIGAEFFLRIDIASFFPSINDSLIKSELSNLVACDSPSEKDKLLDLISNIVTLEGVLPQGARTSPAVSNLVMARADQRITKYCQVFGVRYTRYADDLLFSSNQFDFSKEKWFTKKIKLILGSLNLKLNYSKLKYGNKELALNGYVISKYEIRLSRNRLSDIRHIITFSKNNNSLISQYGQGRFLHDVNAITLKYRDLQVYPFKSVFQFVQYMCGYRAYLISLININGDSSTSFQKELRRLVRKIEEQVSLY